jgi:mycothiol synthase
MPDTGDRWIDIGFRTGKRGPEIRFRRFRGSADFSTMSDICIKSWKADNIEFLKTKEDFESGFKHDAGRDPAEDLLFAHAEGRDVGFAEISVIEKSRDEVKCFQYVHLLPEYRGQGIREALLRYNERVLRQAVSSRPGNERKVFESWSSSDPNDWHDILVREGYEPAWNLFEMVRPDLDDLPDAPLPEGATVRPIREEDYRKVWDASKNIFKGQPWTNDEMWDEAHYEQWLSSPTFMPDLWQIAWDGDEVIGSVQSFIDEDENREFCRRRGHTERIFVTPPWRGKGLAKALIVRSLQLLKDRGMTDATLDTEEANVDQAYKVYERMGFRVVKRFAFYQKPL